ncbi:MAG: permease prefix domain 2-containing transporter, partial [Bacteroidota bacterium]
MSKQPPKFFLLFLRWFCARDLLEEIEGDLIESFKFNAEERSISYARFRFALEVTYLLRPSVIKKLNNYNNTTIMIKNYGKIAFRNFQKNANYALINVLSMSIGLACCIVSYLNYNHNHSFD